MGKKLPEGLIYDIQAIQAMKPEDFAVPGYSLTFVNPDQVNVAMSSGFCLYTPQAPVGLLPAEKAHVQKKAFRALKHECIVATRLAANGYVWLAANAKEYHEKIKWLMEQAKSGQSV